MSGENNHRQPPLACVDCGGDYEALMALSLLIPKAQWLCIHPEDGGLLCAHCMLRRAAKLPGAINITGRITFGDDAADIYASASAGPEAVERQLAEARAAIERLKGLIRDIYNKATPYGVFEEAGEEWVGSYLIPVGPLHRAIGVVGHV